MAEGEFRADLDPRMATLAILGMCNAASSWHRKEGTPIDQIAAEFTQLVLDGVGKRSSAHRRRR
jgi:hypothetical protein